MTSGGVRFKGTLMVAVDRTQIGSDLIVPSTARELLSVTPYAIPTTHTADKTEAVQLELESDDTDLAPTKIAVLVNPPENASVTTAANTMIYKTYDLNVPIGGGDVIKAYGTNLEDPTTDPYFGCGVLISNAPTGKLQTFWTNPGALNLYGVGNNAYVSGATYRFNNCMRINKVYAWACTGTTVTVDDSIGGTFKLESPDFKTNLPQIYPYQTCSTNAVAATADYVPTMSLWNVNIPTDPIVAVTEYLDQEALTVAGNINWISGLGYNKTKKRK